MGLIQKYLMKEHMFGMIKQDSREKFADSTSMCQSYTGFPRSIESIEL